MSAHSPILDLAGLVLEANCLDRAEAYYGGLLGLETVRRDDDAGVLELRFPSGQTLGFWRPATKRQNDARLATLGARGGTHVHYAMQIPVGTRERAKRILAAHGVPWQEINVGDDDFHDHGLYFHDPFGHGLELREVVTDPEDPRAPLIPPGEPNASPYALPVVGLREVALAFTNFAAMLERLRTDCGFALQKLQDERAFAQFTLAQSAEDDGKHTPRRWLYAWDPQVGLAGMFGGEHATVRFVADVDTLAPALLDSGLRRVRDAHGLIVRDPEGHVFEFVTHDAFRDGR